MIFAIIVLALVLASMVLLQIVFSRPPRRGIMGGIEKLRLDLEAPPPVERVERLLPAPQIVLGSPPLLPIEKTLERAPSLPVPQVGLSLVGIEIDLANDERQLWLLARERLERRSRKGK